MLQKDKKNLRNWNLKNKSESGPDCSIGAMKKKTSEMFIPLHLPTFPCDQSKDC